MNIQERIMVFLLTWFDRLMDGLTFGSWSKSRWDKPANYKMKARS